MTLLLSAIAVMVFAFPVIAAHVEYDRAAIAAGEVWRVFSGHWVHQNVDHLLWDLAVFLVLGLACERASRFRFLLCVCASALAIPAALWLWMPALDIYRGLSGIDSALFGLLLVHMWRDGLASRLWRGPVLATVLFVAFVLKIVVEVVAGTNVFVENAGTVSVPLAHLVGLGVGMLAGLPHPLGPGAPVGKPRPAVLGSSAR